MRLLLNLRGAPASGKTTSVKQFCEKYGYTVEYLELSTVRFPVTIVQSKSVVILGDYGKDKKIMGCDAVPKRNRKNIGGEEIRQAVIAVARKYKPNTIIYEYMIGSQIYLQTSRIADAAMAYGYNYLGVQLWRDDASRMRLLESRSGTKVGTKNFFQHTKSVARATEMLNENGYLVEVINADRIPYEDMWRVIENRINKI